VTRPEHTTVRRHQRRFFLKALGLGLAAPLAARMSRLAFAEPDAQRPKRLLVVYVPHGMPAEHFDPAGAGTDFSLSDGPGRRILGPLEPWKDQLILFRGMDIKGHNNHPAIRAVLNADAERSVEQVVGDALGLQALTLGAVTVPSYGFTSDSWLFRNGTWINPNPSPVAAADALFGVQPASPGAGPVDEATLRREALKLTIGEVSALHKSLLGLTRERTKVSTHLQALETLKVKQTPGPGASIFEPTCDGAPVMPTVDAIRAQEPGAGWFYDEGHFSQILQAQLEVATQAMICGAARVIGLQAMYANAQINFGFMGVPKDHHDPISHSSGATGRDEFAQCQRWFIERIAETVITSLDQPDPLDPEHTVLENSVVHFCTEVADGNEHNYNKTQIWVTGSGMDAYVPLLTIGGAGGALKTGRIVDFDNRPHADLLLTLCHAMGVVVPGFGPHSTGVIQEVMA